MKYTINYLNSTSQTTYNVYKTVSELRSMASNWNKSFEGIDKMVSVDYYIDLLPGCKCRTIIL